MCDNKQIKNVLINNLYTEEKGLTLFWPGYLGDVIGLKKKGSFYQACERPVLLYGSETWPVKEEDLVRLRDDHAALDVTCHI